MSTLPFQLPNQRVRPKNLEPDERLFRHRLRPSWGIGLWVREEPNRRRLRFEDGELRAFRKGFYHLLLPVEAEDADVETLFEQIATEHEHCVGEEHLPDSKPPVMSFAEQVAVFKSLYPGGFTDPGYLDHHRAPSGDRTRKAHVDPVIQQAQRSLSEARLREAVQSGRHGDVHADVVGLLKATDLVTPARCKPIAHLPAEEQGAFLNSLTDLLYGEGRYRERFERWLSTLRQATGGELRWPVVTALPALVHPERHVVVRERVFQLQARVVAPAQRLKRRPSRRGYRTARKIARATRDQLQSEGLAPRDLFDVRTFIWETLRPRGQTRLIELSAGS